MSEQGKKVRERPVLIFAHTNKLPVAIRACTGFRAVVLRPFSTHLVPGLLRQQVESQDPCAIFIDGNFGEGDGALKGRLSAMTLKQIRVALSEGREVPLAVKLLFAIRPVTDHGVPIVFFVDCPSKAFTQVLAKPADIIWPALTFKNGREGNMKELLRRRSRRRGHDGT